MSPLVYLNQWRQLYKSRPIRRHWPWGISVYNVTICYVNQWCWLYKKLANMSALALASDSENINVQGFR